MSAAGGRDGRRVAGRTAVVTGAGDGIGRATALLLAEHGANVVCVDVRGEAAERIAAAVAAHGVGSLAVEADVSSASQTQAMADAAVERFGTIDILHNNAGIGVFSSVHELEEDDWDRVISVNLKGIYLGAKAVLPYMLSAGSGAVVNTCSTFALLASPQFAAYHASKGGVLGLTRQMALDYGPAIRVNAVSPGTVESCNIRWAISRAPDPAEQQRVYERSNPVMQRIGDPREIAYGVLFLASDEASFVTGHDLIMGGGQGLRAA